MKLAIHNNGNTVECYYYQYYYCIITGEPSIHSWFTKFGPANLHIWCNCHLKLLHHLFYADTFQGFSM